MDKEPLVLDCEGPINMLDIGWVQGNEVAGLLLVSDRDHRPVASALLYACCQALYTDMRL